MFVHLFDYHEDMNLSAVRTAVADLYAALAAPADGSSDAAGNLDAERLLETVELAQLVINISGGIQAHAIAHLAAHDEVRDDEDETGWAWRRHGLGFTAEDTASLLAPRLGVSVPVAQGRVEVAVHQVCVTPRLVDAMGSGHLDLFRAQVITREVMPCSDEVAREIVDRLLHHYSGPNRFTDTAGPLGSRTRRLVARLAPEVAAAAKEKAVADRALTRRAVSAAADLWNGLVPVEQSLVMWQAIDELARDLQRDNPELTLDQARLDAMQQLVLGQADVTIHLHATHAEGDTDGQEPAAANESSAHDDARDVAADPLAAEGESGLDARSQEATAPPRAGGSSAAAGLAERAVRGIAGASRVVELGGLGRPGTTVVDLGALPPCVRLLHSTPLGCHAETGALLSGVVPKALAPCDVRPSAVDGVDGPYRPPPALQRLVRLRDGHCRFPGCQIAARSCDLDHVRPWPGGPTSALNLMCLCRRHHRVKQRPGWSVRLGPDGVVHWSDPLGRAIDTHPVDHLDRIVQLDPVDHLGRSDQLDPADGLGRTAPTMSTPSTEASPDSTHGRMTRERLADLLRGEPTPPDTLTELALARLLDLAQTGTRPASPVQVDWYVPPGALRVDSAVGGRPEPPLKDEPPPF